MPTKKIYAKICARIYRSFVTAMTQLKKQSFSENKF